MIYSQLVLKYLFFNKYVILFQYQLTAFEAHLVPFESTSDTFLCSVDRFAAFGAFWMFNWLERHFVYTEKSKVFHVMELQYMN